MSLRIHGNNQRFRQAVLAAMAEICPCWLYSVTAEGVVELQSPAEGGHEGFCRCYCRHRAGCNLMADLASAAGEVVIGPGSPAAYHPPSRRLRWNPRSRPRVRTSDGRRRSSPATVLGHELIHAHHHNEGTLADGRTNGIKNEEIETVRGENQLREERGEPQRTHYGRRAVPNPGAGNLDASDRHDCGCEEGEGDGARTSPDEGSDHAMLDGFEDLAAERDGLGDDVRLALEEREDHPAFVHLRGRTRALAESTRAVLLQRLDAGTLDYRFILFRAGKEELLLETNVMPLHEDGITYMGDPGDVRVYRVEAMPTAAMKAAFTEGVGGDADVLDGAVDLLAVKTEGRVRRCALVGCDYPLFAAWDVEPPPGKEDAARYQAISEVFDVWARILAERPEPLRLIPLDTGI